MYSDASCLPDAWLKGLANTPSIPILHGDLSQMYTFVGNQTESRFRAALRNGESKRTAMNGLESVEFSNTPCIGTDGLGGCSVVVIVSPFAAMLGHVSPRPIDSDPDDTDVGDKHVRTFVRRVTNRYQQFQELFPANSSCWVICAEAEGAVALPIQQKIIDRELRVLGLTVDTSQTYHVPYTPDYLDRGSIFVDGTGHTIRVYVENRLVQSIPRHQPVETTAVVPTIARAWTNP
jgi:hypothetical protein